MEFVVGAALALLSAIVLAYPFLTARSGARQKNLALGSQALELASVYQAIRDLQWEHQAGELPEDLYLRQLDAYRRQAALMLREESVAAEADEALERDVAANIAGGGGQPPRNSGT